MKRPFVLLFSLLLFAWVLNGCEQQAPTPENGEADIDKPQAPELIYQIDDVSLSILESDPLKLTITSRGMTSTAGWTSPQLSPFQYIQPPPDGIYDYSFVAQPPDGPVAQVLTPITANLTLDSIPTDMKGVRIHARQNNKVAMLQPSAEAWFEFKGSDPTDRFVFKIIEQDKINHARALLAGQTSETPHVMGIIVKSKASYNPSWSYHLEPASIEFFEMAIEVCDSNMQYVEEHLDEVGGAFLPDNKWCPWSSELTREVSPLKHD